MSGPAIEIAPKDLPGSGYDPVLNIIYLCIRVDQYDRKDPLTVILHETAHWSIYLGMSEEEREEQMTLQMILNGIALTDDDVWGPCVFNTMMERLAWTII